MTERDEGGMTMVETVIALAVMGMLLPLLIGILYLMMTIPLRGSDTLQTSLEADQTVQAVSVDARTAGSFSPSAVSPDYGTFRWTDYTSEPPVVESVRYYYSDTVTSLIREETVDGNVVSSRSVATNILSYADVSFVQVGSDAVSIAVTSTIASPASATGFITKQTTGLAFLRPQQQIPGVFLSAERDSFVSQISPNTNYGTDSTLLVRSTTLNRAWVQFNLSSIPAGSTVQTATLRLYLSTAPATSRSYDAHRVTASWEEATVTWNNQPSVAATATFTQTTGTTPGVWMEWNVLADVQTFVNAPASNYGWRISDQAESDLSNTMAVFFSMQNAGIAFRPQLVVEYAGSAPTPTPTSTSTPTPTATNTPIPTSTSTNTPVPTSTSTNTPVPTSTSTNTPTPTFTSTPTPTATFTPSPTPTPTSVTLGPSDDAHVNENNPNNNYGTSSSLIVRSTSGGSPDTNYRTFIRFDTSGIPAAATVFGASLRLYMSSDPGASRSYDAHRVTGAPAWAEGAITWDNQPAVAGSATDTQLTGTANNVWIEWDVTVDVQNFINLSQSNYGWRIKDQAESSGTNRQATFRSQEYGTASQRPQLVVTYSAPPPTPTATPTSTATPTNTPTPTLTPTPTPLSLTLGSSDDSYVDQTSANANTNFGASTSLLVASRSGPNRNRRTFARFDASGIPAGATIASASLRLYMSTAPSNARNYDAFRVTGIWTEGAITWNNQPGVAASATDAQPSGGAGWKTWDVTADVQSFVNAASSNYGWRINDQIESQSSTNRQATFRSSEFGTVGQRPQLVVNYWP